MVESSARFPALPQSRFPVPRKLWKYISPLSCKAKIDQLVIETGCAPNRLVEDAVAAYVDELLAPPLAATYFMIAYDFHRDARLVAAIPRTVAPLLPLG